MTLAARILACLALALAAGGAVAQAPRAGGAAVVAVSGDPGHFNPAISTAGPLHAVAGSLYNGLVALDRRQILDRVVFGQGRVASAPIASGIAWAHASGLLDGITVDVAAANRLLDEAGLARGADGVRATFDILHFPAFARYSELMRQNLAAVGIALNVRMLDPAAFAPAVFTDRAFDLALISYCNGTDPEIGVRRMVHSTSIGTVPFSNAAHVRDAEIDRLFDDAVAILADRPPKAG